MSNGIGRGESLARQLGLVPTSIQEEVEARKGELLSQVLGLRPDPKGALAQGLEELPQRFATGAARVGQVATGVVAQEFEDIYKGNYLTSANAQRNGAGAIKLDDHLNYVRQTLRPISGVVKEVAETLELGYGKIAEHFNNKLQDVIRNGDPFFRQQIVDKDGNVRWDLATDPSYLMYSILSGGGSMLPNLVLSAGAATVTKSPTVGLTVMSVLNGGMEAAGTYDAMIDKGMTQREAYKGYLKMFAYVAAGTRFIGLAPALFGSAGKVATGSVAAKILRVGAWESVEEMSEEWLNGYLVGDKLKETVFQSFNVLPATIGLSMLGGIGIAYNSSVETRYRKGIENEYEVLNKFYGELGRAEQMQLDDIKGLIDKDEHPQAQRLIDKVAMTIDTKYNKVKDKIREQVETAMEEEADRELDNLEKAGAFEGAAQPELTEEQDILFALNDKKRELSEQGLSKEEIAAHAEIVGMQKRMDDIKATQKARDKVVKEEVKPVEEPVKAEPKVEPEVEKKAKPKEEAKSTTPVKTIEVIANQVLEGIDQILASKNVAALAVGKLKKLRTDVQSTINNVRTEGTKDDVAFFTIEKLLRDKVGIASTLTDIAAYDTNMKNKKQKIAEYKKTLDPKSVRAKGETISDFDFANISDGHASLLQYWQDLFEQNSLEVEQVAALKEMYAGRQVGEDLALEVEDVGAGVLGETSPFVPIIRMPANILRQGERDKGEGLTTFLHESLHAWLHHKASKTDADKARSIVESISKQERFGVWRDAGLPEGSASYLSEDEEFLAHQFVLYTTREYISPNAKLNSIFDKVLEFIKQRIPFIENVYPQVREDLAPFFEQVLGEKIEVKPTPAPAPKPKAKAKPKAPAKPKVVLRDYAELTNDPEALEVIAEDMVDFVKATDKAVVKDIVKWLQGQMNISEDDALDFIEDYGDISLLPPIEGITMDAVVKYKPGLRDLNEQGLVKAIATIEGRIADKAAAMEEQQVRELDEELVDLELQLDYAKKRLSMFKRGKAMEPIDTTTQPVNDTSTKKMGWREVRRKFRDITKWANKYDQKSRIQAKEDLLAQFDDVVFPMMNKKTADPLAILRSIIDEVVFKELESVNVQIKNSINAHTTPQLMDKAAVKDIRKALDTALRQAAAVAESIEHLEDISEFSKSAVKADAEAITMQLVGIIDSLNESNLAQDYEDIVGALSRALNDVAASLPTKLRTTAQWIASPTSEVEALAESAGEARNKGMTMSQWRKSLPADARANAKFGWRYALVSDTGGSQGAQMAHVKVSGQQKGRKGIFTTRDMVVAIAAYKGADMKVFRSKPIYYIFESMDKMMPGVGFAKLADRYQVALTLHRQYTERILSSMTAALRGVNTYDLGIYAAVKDTPKMREYLISKGVKVDEIYQRTAANRKAMAAYDLGHQHFNDMWVAINKTRMRLGKDPIPYRSDYFTFIRAHDRLNQGFSDLITAPYAKIVEMFEESERDLGMHREETTRFSFTERKPGPKPIELRYDRVFKTYTDIASKHMHFSPIITATRELTGTMFIPGTEDSQQAVSLEHRGLVNVRSELDRWADFIIGTKKGKEFGENVAPWVDKLIGRITNNVATYTMGFVLRTAIIQPTANYLTAINIGHDYFFNALKQWGAAHLMGDPEVRRRLGLSHHLPTRTPEAIMEEIKNNISNLSPQNAVETLALAGNRLQSGAFFFIQHADMATAEVGWLAAFQYGKDNGLSDKQAATAADRLIAKTHGGSAPGLRAPIQRTNVGRGLTLFQTFQLNEFWHLISELAFTDSMTIPGLEQAQDNINGVKRQLLNKGVKEKDIEQHAQMLAVRKRHGKLGRVWDTDALKAERTRRIMMYLIYSALINSFYEDFIGINSPLPAPVRAAWQAYMKDDGAFQMIKSSLLEFIKQIPVIGGGAYGGGLLGAGADYVDDVTDWMSGKRGAAKPASELLGKTFGVPLLHQINKSIKSAENGGNLYEIAIGMYPGHRRMLIDIIALASGEDPYVE